MSEDDNTKPGTYFKSKRTKQYILKVQILEGIKFLKESKAHPYITRRRMDVLEKAVGV